jgi:STE24 endopeptidase
VRRFWLLLWTPAVLLSLVSLFATLAARPISKEALRFFSLETLLRGRQFTREVQTAFTGEFLASMAAMLWLCFSEPGARLLHRLEQIGGRRSWLNLAAVAAGVTVLIAGVELPFSFYAGFLHEHAYGLTHQTAAGWLADYLTNTGLHLLLSLALWLPVYWLIRRLPCHWWAPAALFSAGYTGLMILLGPVLLLPMSSHLAPVRDPQLLAMIQRLADRAGVQVEKVQELAVSEKTTRVNAMVTGLGATKQIILYDTLLQQFPPQEVEVVMAHELAHAAHQDVVINWALSGVGDVALLSLAAWMLTAMVETGPLRLPVVHAPRGLALILLLSTLFSNVTAPMQNYISRQMEVRADRFALTVTNNPAAFISGFRKLARGNPGDVDPPPLVEFLDHSHPSIMNRIQAAEAHGTR